MKILGSFSDFRHIFSFRKSKRIVVGELNIYIFIAIYNAQCSLLVQLRISNLKINLWICIIGYDISCSSHGFLRSQVSKDGSMFQRNLIHNEKKIEIKLHVMCDSATEWTYVRADGKLHTHTTHTYIYQPPLELRKYIYRNPLWLRVGRVGSLKKTENMASSASKYMMLSLSMDARCLFWYKTNFAPKWKIFPRTPTHVPIFVTLEYATDCTYLSSYRIVSASQQTWQHDIYIHQLWTSILWLCYDFWYICTQLAQI